MSAAPSPLSSATDFAETDAPPTRSGEVSFFPSPAYFPSNPGPGRTTSSDGTWLGTSNLKAEEENRVNLLKEQELEVIDHLKFFICSITMEAPECFVEAIEPLTKSMRAYFFAGGSATGILEVIQEYIVQVPRFVPRAVDMVAYMSEIFGKIPHLDFNRKLAMLFGPSEQYDALQEFREHGRVDERLLAVKHFWKQVRQTWELPKLERSAEEIRIYHCLRMPLRH